MTINPQFSNDCAKLDKAMTAEQFHQIVEAILAGKYSWACVLILRYAGYNPLHYIPYTTYIRLVKDHQQQEAQNRHKTLKEVERPMTDLHYLEKLEEGSGTIRGGDRAMSNFRLHEFSDRNPEKIFLPNW